MGGWGQFTACSASCGLGHKRRARTIESAAQDGGKPCGATLEQVSCDLESCPTDCTVTRWGNWSECHSTYHWPCAQRRERKINATATAGGRRCPSLDSWRKCNAAKCTVPKATGCDLVRCEFVQDDSGRGHVRVFHHKGEPKTRHSCEKLHTYTIEGRSRKYTHHDFFAEPCDCQCYSKEEEAAAGSAAAAAATVRQRRTAAAAAEVLV
jgi:hypothetical protein